MLSPLPALKASMLIEDAFTFLNRAECRYAAVESERGVIGLCSQRRIGTVLGTRFGYALNARSTLRDFLVPESLVVRVDDSLVDILNRAFDRDEEQFWHDVVVTDRSGAYLGLLKTRTLVKLQSRLLGEKVQDLEERQVALERTTNQLIRSNQELEIARDRGLQAARAKSEFLAVMSHEIRTPLNGVLGMITLLADSKLDRDQKELLHAASDSAEALLLILNDILDFSRLEAGRIELDPRRFDVRALAESVLTLMAESAQESGLEVVCEIGVDVPQTIVADSGRIRQILANLLGNAVKFTERGEIVLTLSRDCRDGKCVGLRFSVQDSGIGISPEAQKRIFKPFAQADSSTTRRFGGTGLGLAICAQLVEAMGGEIGVESEQGVGSRFWFTVQCSECEKTCEPYLARNRGEGKRVLLRAENSKVAKVLADEFAYRGYDVSYSRSLEACRQDYDLAVVDERYLKTLEEGELEGRPAIVLHSSHGSELKDESGKRAHLCKPVKPSQIDRCLDALMGSAGDGDSDEESFSDMDAAPGCEPPRARVLVVEDNAVNRRLVTHIIGKLGYDCHQAEDGLEALEKCVDNEYDVILLDCRMPRMDGYEFARKLRQAEEESGTGARMPLIALTANAMQGDRELCFAAGMDAYLTKPIKKKLLAEMLERALEGRLQEVEDESCCI
ncbi:ATP-binding protein [Pelagicoccus sp. SDUM812003]|uniref:ATP-binding protein n=1 Tax=Pelagicoccus sp. SDUM812003 TaxID=3041267 RepID=UPI00280D200F|nr:ATP-binding protein [Pelagicoccus sp. SDUM812003]MDQ8203108.1 ATP-binding protein [Pelagicoccus sp. SDUM812003]